MKFIKVWYVVNRYGRFVCGPFRDSRVADTWAKRYSNHFWGACHVEEYEKEVSEI